MTQSRSIRYFYKIKNLKNLKCFSCSSKMDVPLDKTTNWNIEQIDVIQFIVVTIYGHRNHNNESNAMNVSKIVKTLFILDNFNAIVER